MFYIVVDCPADIVVVVMYGLFRFSTRIITIIRIVFWFGVYLPANTNPIQIATFNCMVIRIILWSILLSGS